MLVLTREVGQKLLIGNDVIITVTKISGNKVRIGVQAPDDVTVIREELVPARTGEIEHHVAARSAELRSQKEVHE